MRDAYTNANATSSTLYITLSRIVLIFALFIFTIAIARLAANARIAFSFPYAFDYGEGVVWQQLRDIVAGQAYRPIGTYPAVAYEYPPIFHLCAATVAALLRIDQLYAGRLVSVTSVTACAFLVGQLTYRALAGENRTTRWAAAVIAGLAFATLPVVGVWALLMRIDLLACAFTLAGMAFASRAPRSMAASVLAGLAFALALYTRQTCLAAPAAAFVVLLIVCSARAWTMAATALASGSAALIAVEIATRGGFLLNIVSYNVNRIIWDHAGALVMVLLANVVMIAIATIGAATTLRELDPRGWRDLRSRLSDQPQRIVVAIVLLTLAFKTLTLPAILKSGASDNYLIDWFSEIAILVGIAVVPLLRAAQRLPAKPSIQLLALIGVGLPLQVAGLALFPDPAAAEQQRRGLDTIVERIRHSSRPVISDDATLLLRAGQPMRWEPSIVAELGSTGRYDERRFVDMIHGRRFAFFVTDGDRGDVMFDQRFSPAIADEIQRSYPRRVRIADRTLHLPLADIPASTPLFR